MGLEVTVDPELCIGSGDCVARVPAAFELDDRAGVAIVRADAAEGPVELVVDAAMGCPTQAIRVVRSGSVLHESNG